MHKLSSMHVFEIGKFYVPVASYMVDNFTIFHLYFEFFIW